ncbi:conserved hypothetical protein [Burkholderia pseudomallei Pakistan 9]|nr:conserved hypothetical protein [Burkholderia pseudomallei Pakistan 9]
MQRVARAGVGQREDERRFALRAGATRAVLRSCSESPWIRWRRETMRRADASHDRASSRPACFEAVLGMRGGADVAARFEVALD